MGTANDKPSLRPEVLRLAKLASLKSCLCMYESGWSMSAICRVYNDIPEAEIRGHIKENEELEE